MFALLRSTHIQIFINNKYYHTTQSKFSEIPDEFKNIINKYAKHPRIQEVKNALTEFRDSFTWYSNVLKQLEELGEYRGDYLDTMHRCISDIELKYKSGELTSEEMQQFIKDRFRNAKLVNFNNRHLVFGERARQVFDSIEQRYLEAITNKKVPYLTPDSKFTNEVFVRIQEDIIYVFRDAFSNAFEISRKGRHMFDDPIQTMEELLLRYHNLKITF